jgi:hypothetical protein
VTNKKLNIKTLKSNFSLLIFVILLELGQNFKELTISFFNLSLVFGSCEDNLPGVKYEGCQLRVGHFIDQARKVLSL